jgi:hypothetical protein
LELESKKKKSAEEEEIQHTASHISGPDAEILLDLIPQINSRHNFIPNFIFYLT